MPHDPFIAETVRQRIGRELKVIEREQHVRILLAVESGSRAWRFPSPDSDYDVRFIYVHPPEVYLSLKRPRDVIERPIEDMLDINGWDIRKTLQLLVRSNATLLEWLSSPVRYREADVLPARLHKLAREACHLPALTYHYDRLARHSFEDIVSSSGSLRLKTYCYAIRPALALLWMRRHGEPPPMDLPGLLDGIVIADAVRQAIFALVEKKATSAEDGTTARCPEVDAFLAGILIEMASRSTLPDRPAVLAHANALFASIVLGQRGTHGDAPE